MAAWNHSLFCSLFYFTSYMWMELHTNIRHALDLDDLTKELEWYSYDNC